MSEKVVYRPEIDSLRAIAVAAVIAFHAFPQLLPGGFVGVDIFFVISGYLITGVILIGLRDDTFSIVDFYVRRVRRILPALLIVLACCLCAGWFLLGFQEYVELGRHVSGAVRFVLNFRLLREVGYFDTSAELKPLLHLWSLSVEEQFYLIWPFLLVIAWRFKKIVALLFVVIVLSLFASIVQTITNPEAAFFLPTTRFWELMVGAALTYDQARRGGSFPVAFQDTRANVGLLLIAVSFILVNRESEFPGYLALLPTIGTALMISAGADARVNRALRWTPLVFAGLISYSLYLWHWPLFSFARVREGQELPAVTAILLTLIAVVLASATYLLVEKPLRKVKWLRFKYRFAPAVLILIAVVGVVGAYLPRSTWALLRFPSEVRGIASYRFDKKVWRVEECFLQVKQTFAPTCIDPVGTDAKSLLMLWGDSHAAQLVPGLRTLQADTRAFRFAQFTAAGCPPILAVRISNPWRCEEINEFVLDQIRQTKPDVVLIAGHWLAYYQLEHRRWHFDLSELTRTVRLVQAAGAKRVVLMGQVPTWKISQTKVMIDLFLKTGSIPERTNFYLEPKSFSVDRVLRPAIAETGASYIFPFEYLCDQAGCVIQVAAEPVFFDTNHFTVAGSNFFIQRISSSLLPHPQ